jgi:hypothetical protein
MLWVIDPELSREERYSQQQRLRMAVFKHSTEKQELAEQRRSRMTLFAKAASTALFTSSLWFMALPHISIKLLEPR